MDPAAPKTLYAGMWDFRRKGWTFRSGGDGEDAPSGSGLFKSTDGGATWSSLDDKSAPGLPPNELSLARLEQIKVVCKR